jgi:hypothetical protein
LQECWSKVIAIDARHDDNITSIASRLRAVVDGCPERTDPDRRRLVCLDFRWSMESAKRADAGDRAPS